MFKRVGSLIQYGLLATLLVYGLYSNWGVPQIYTFLSILILGVILGLLFLIYNIRSMAFSQKLGTHLAFSALAILIVALFNNWIQINWGQVFTWILILSGLALLAYIGYQYLMNNKKKSSQQKEVVDQPEEYDAVTGAVAHPDDQVDVERDSIERQEPFIESEEVDNEKIESSHDDQIVIKEYHYEDEPIDEIIDDTEVDHQMDSKRTDANNEEY
ncbi:DUF3021 family protein [Facklamia sp. DSM 111018]|uniref:DUF3021 family protein n=1 Tax=Facklamia lactis TaxID=2749967 RepID=A0ABS0LSI5_9LACT|nr:DUF3021 family protein [Facklamia lactis]MBG9981399.1 DUF3021 family protein [Facklamia lactis]MBG9987125.1 DUF3021 family protein [Facklamia lactis]